MKRLTSDTLVPQELTDLLEKHMNHLLKMILDSCLSQGSSYCAGICSKNVCTQVPVDVRRHSELLCTGCGRSGGACLGEPLVCPLEWLGCHLRSSVLEGI